MKFTVNEYEWRDTGMHRICSCEYADICRVHTRIYSYCEKNDLVDIYEKELEDLWQNLLRMDQGDICRLQFHVIGRLFSIYTIPDDI